MYRLLNSVKVIEWAEFIAGPYCAAILSNLGAEVIKVERPRTGDVARYREPFLNDEPDPEKSGLFLFVNTNKLGITLDVSHDTGKNIFKKLLLQTDVLIHDKPPQVLSQLGLEYPELQEWNPRLVVTAISPFGQTGPYSKYKSYPLNTFHAGGEGYITPGGSTFFDRPPIKCGKFVGEYESANLAGAATLLALYVQQSTGQGQLVDISQQQCLTWLTGFDLFRWPNYGIQVTRFTRGYTYTGVLACKDGWVMYSPMRDDEWEAMLEVIGHPDWAKDEKYQTREGRDQMGKALLRKLEEETKKFTKAELYTRAQVAKCPLAPFNAPDEVAKSKQFEFRNFFIEIDHPKAGRLRYPSYPYRFPLLERQPSKGAPLLGEHNVKIYCDRLGITRQELVKLFEAGVI